MEPFTFPLKELQVLILAIKHPSISGIEFTSNKPFAAYSGNMCGHVQANDNLDYAFVRIFNII